MNYSDKLKNPRWQKRRLEIFNRDGWLCRRCRDADSTLHVHHKAYLPDREPWDYPDDMLETLCDHCHGVEHGLQEPAQEIPPLTCAACKAVLMVSQVAGRNGKNEPLCEPCALGMEREHFDSRS